MSGVQGGAGEGGMPGGAGALQGFAQLPPGDGGGPAEGPPGAPGLLQSFSPLVLQPLPGSHGSGL